MRIDVKFHSQFWKNKIFKDEMYQYTFFWHFLGSIAIDGKGKLFQNISFSLYAFLKSRKQKLLIKFLYILFIYQFSFQW